MKNQKNKKRLPPFKILSTTAILGYGFPESSFKRGLSKKPDLIAADAGSTDPGPYYLGSGKSFTNRTAVKRDLRLMIKAGVERKIPVIIGSAGGSGARPHLEWCLDIVREIAREENLHFRLGIARADVDKDVVLKALNQKKIKPMPFVSELTPEAIFQSENIVAQMGIEPFVKLLQKGSEVIIAGRSYDPAVFAALPIYLGYAPGLAFHLGKILECAAIAATPGSGSDCALGILEEDDFILEALSPERKFTPQSAAAHTLYEKSDPYQLPGPGGMIDLRECSFEDIGNGRVRVRGSKFIPADPYTIKIEGARLIGFRSISIAGARDPIMITKIDSILKSVEIKVREILKDNGNNGKIYFHVYGKNGVMGELEPIKKILSPELGIVIETIGKTQEEADSLLALTRSILLHYGYEGRISTAGNLAFPFSPSDVAMGKVYEFSIYHLMEIDDPANFKTEIEEL
ncbi:MAG TPA: acyclic terpene utilization AtuA family protein [Candidatus Aminicenantes bacterium]|nr:acyclic terpene utilization AtuA family protein [Candidatus Aminicenantes bacterium]